MTDEEAKAYDEGYRQAQLMMMQRCMAEVAPKQDLTVARLVLEREQAIQALRSLCREFGDNDWKIDSPLGEIIERHLGNHLRKQE